MDLNYLVNEILPQRKQEIQKGKNLGTRNPLYFVFDSVENFVSGHSAYEPITNLLNKHMEFGYIDEALDPEIREFKISDNRMKEPQEVTKFYTDKYVAVFLTSKAAHDYKKYQRHNLKDPFVYVHHPGYRNAQMEELFKDEK